jgi:peptidoglycan/LPS O-acetylase OafA/YrhL
MFLGRISFPLYLIHLMPLVWLRHFFSERHPDSPWKVVATLAFVTTLILASYGLHRVVERPVQRWGRSLITARRPNQSP